MNNYAKEKFEEEYGDSKNFATPNVLGYFQKGNYFIELSQGYIFDTEMFGVTVVEEIDGYIVRRKDLSSAFRTLEKAKKYIDSL